MSNWENPDPGGESVPPPPSADPAPSAGTGPSIPPPPTVTYQPSNRGSAVGGGCLSSAGAVVILFSLILFSYAGDARAESSGFMTGLGDFLSGVAQLTLLVGVVLLVIGLVILKRLRS